MYSNKSIEIVSLTIIIYFKQQEIKQYVANPGGGGGGGGVLRCCLDGGARLKPPNPYPSLRVILAEKGTHY